MNYFAGAFKYGVPAGFLLNIFFRETPMCNAFKPADPHSVNHWRENYLAGSFRHRGFAA